MMIDRPTALHVISNVSFCCPHDVHTKALYILSVYSPFSDRVGLPLHNRVGPGG